MIAVVPCTGAIEAVQLLHMLRQEGGAIMVVGCLKGNCLHCNGNYQAERTVGRVRYILEQIGLEKERVEMFFISSDGSSRLISFIEIMFTRSKDLGPLGKVATV